MAEDWIDKIVRDDESARNEAKAKAARDAAQERELKAKWPNWSGSFADEARQRVDKFNAAMKVRRPGWRVVTFDSAAGNFSIGREYRKVTVTLDHDYHRVSVTGNGMGADRPTHYDMRNGASKLEAYRSEYGSSKHITDLLEEILRPLFEELMRGGYEE